MTGENTAPREPSAAERIAASYLAQAQGDVHAALLNAIRDAMAYLTERERRTARAERLVSRGYARSGLEAPGHP